MTEQEPTFTVFDKHYRWLLIAILSSVGFWSMGSNQIFFPALPIVSKHFQVSPAAVNLVVMGYLIFQGIMPSISSSLALYYGSRPLLVGSLIAFVAVCISISQTNTFWLLALLRCLQAMSISPVIAIGSGVSGDVCTIENRGSFIGTVSGFQLIGSGFGAVIGAALLSGFNSWRAIFVFVSIGGVFTLIVAVCFLPETSRQYVGNGSIIPQLWYHKSLILYFSSFHKKLTGDMETLESRKPFNLLSAFKILMEADVWFVLSPAGLAYASWSVMLTSLSTVLSEPPFSYSTLHIGISYLPQGIGTIVGSFSSGRILDWYCKHREQRSREAGMVNERVNYLRARLDICLIPIASVIFSLTLFGWSLQYQLHISLIYISSIIIGFSVAVTVACVTTALVDMYPRSGQASSSCVNLFRSLPSALFVAVLDSMVQSMGLGGTYSFLAGICAVSSGFMFWRFYTKSGLSRVRKQKGEAELETDQKILVEESCQEAIVP